MRPPEVIKGLGVGYLTVRCVQCGIDYDHQEVSEASAHPAALHILRFTCPKGHRTENRRMWKPTDIVSEIDPDRNADRLSAGGVGIVWDEDI